MAKEAIGEILKRLRLEAGISQRQLAKLSGVDREYICQIERGKVKSITLRIAEALAKGLGKSPITFFADAPEETFEETLNHLKHIAPRSVPVYLDYPYHAGDGIVPTDYIYRRPKLAGGNLEAYLIRGKCLYPVVDDGDIIIVARETGIANGDLVACLMDNKPVLGRIRKIADELWLENNIEKFKFENCRDAAPVIEVRKRLK